MQLIMSQLDIIKLGKHKVVKVEKKCKEHRQIEVFFLGTRSTLTFA